MSIDRRSVLKLLPAVASALAHPSSLAATPSARISLQPVLGSYLPLQQITLRGADFGTVVVTDGAGKPYVESTARDPLVFTTAGALGRHTARVLDAKGAIRGSVDFKVDCNTELQEESGADSFRSCWPTSSGP